MGAASLGAVSYGVVGIGRQVPARQVVLCHGGAWQGRPGLAVLGKVVFGWVLLGMAGEAWFGESGYV